MRRAAILLILTLVGPSIATAICELSCLHHAHHAAATRAPSTDCHGHDSGADRPAVDAAGWPCHDAAVAVAAVVEAAAQQTADRASRGMPALVAWTSGAPVLTRANRFRPPDVLLITTQLRI